MKITASNLVHDLQTLEAADFTESSPPVLSGFGREDFIPTYVSQLPLLAQGIILRKILSAREGSSYNGLSADEMTSPRAQSVLCSRLEEIFTG